MPHKLLIKLKKSQIFQINIQYVSMVQRKEQCVGMSSSVFEKKKDRIRIRCTIFCTTYTHARSNRKTDADDVKAHATGMIN